MRRSLKLEKFLILSLRTAESSTAIADHERYQIQQLTQKSSAVLEQVESDIEQQTEKLILLENETDH